MPEPVSRALPTRPVPICVLACLIWKAPSERHGRIDNNPGQNRRTGGGNQQKKRTNRLRQKNWYRNGRQEPERMRAASVASWPPLFFPSCGNAAFPPVMPQTEGMQRDPEAPEVTVSGKQRESPNREHISVSGPPTAKLGIVCELIFSVQLRVVRGHRSFTVCRGSRGNVTRHRNVRGHHDSCVKI